MTRGIELLPDSARPAIVRAETVWNIAYGSNMDMKKIKSRTPNGRKQISPLQAIPVTVPGYTLAFTLPAIPPGEPVMANALPVSDPAPSQPVLHGIAYELTRYDYDSLCMSEHCCPAHFQASYDEVTVTALPYDKDIKPISGTIFEHARGDTCRVAKLPASSLAHLHASRRYLNLLRDGASAVELDADYLAWLNALPEARPIRSAFARTVNNLTMVAVFSCFNSVWMRRLAIGPVKRGVLPTLVKWYVRREAAAAEGRWMSESFWNALLVTAQVPTAIIGAFCTIFIKGRVLFKE